MLRAVVFFGLIISAFASAALDVLVNVAASFSATIQQQLEVLQSNPSPAEFAEKTIDYAEAKEAYFKALRSEVPELLKIATGRQAKPPGLDTFAAAFAVAGEKQEMVTDQETLALLKRFSRDSGVAKARAEFEHVQRAEETFHKDFDGLDLTISVTRIRTIAPPASFPVATIQK
jgi:hypothetical protein